MTSTPMDPDPTEDPSTVGDRPELDPDANPDLPDTEPDLDVGPETAAS